MVDITQSHDQTKLPFHKLHFDNGVYDGRYVWVPSVSPNPLLVVIDPETEEVWRFTAADGVPPSSRAVVALAESPGSVYIAGAFERTWVAQVQFDRQAKLTVKVLLEASEQLDGTIDPQKQVTNPKLSFDPMYLILWASPKRLDHKFLVVGRDNLGTTGHYPGMLDLENGVFTIGRDRLTSHSIPSYSWGLHDGTVYWIDEYLSPDVSSRQYLLTVYRLHLPEMTREVMAADITPPGEWIRSTIFFDKNRMNIVGDTWCRSDQWGKAFEPLQLRRTGTPELPGHLNKIPGTELYAEGNCPPIRFCISSHYGLVNFGSSAGVFRISLYNSSPSASPSMNTGK